MIIVSCITNNYGLLFNNRRIAQDRTILELVYKQFIHFKKLHPDIQFFMNKYSYKLFLTYLNNLNPILSKKEYLNFIKSIIVSDSFLDEAGQYDICFVECNDTLPYFKSNKVIGIIFYKWNNAYPCDYFFALPSDFTQHFILQKETKHIGHSHSTILEEVLRHEQWRS